MQNHRYIILFPLLFISYCLLGQDNKLTLPVEEITLHTDRSLYLTNETVYFKAFCLTEGLLESPLSKILYVELFDQKNRAFVQKKYVLENGLAHGSFIVPEELRTNNYYLRAYTSYQRNFEADTYYQTTLKIVNPKTAGNSISLENSVEKDTAQTKVNTPAPQNSFSISINKNSYAPREKVSLTIDFPTDFVSASIAVRPKATATNTDSFLRPQSVSLKEDTLKFLPEVRGMSIYGLLQNSETKKTLTDMQCVISALGEQTQIHASQTNKEGIFSFQLENLQEVQTLFIGTPKEKAAADLLIWSDFEKDFADFEQELLGFDSLQHSYIEDLFLQQQILKNFPTKATKPSYPKNTIQTFSNLSPPDITVQTADFIDMASLEEIFRDIVPAVKVKGRKNERFLTIFNPETKQTLNDPLILLDNVPISNIETLLEIKPNKLERIEVISSDYVLGDYLFSGIILLHTNTNNFADYKWSNTSGFVEYSFIAASKPFKQIDYEEQNIENSYPDFRSTLFWSPNLSREKEELTFYTSDYCAEYEVIVRGVDKKGNYGEERVMFSVVK